MYIGDVHIITYIIFLILGAIAGQFVDWINIRVLENKKIFSKEIKQLAKKKLNINYFSVITTAILYIVILYRFGIKENLLENLDLMKYMVLIPILISIITIDYKNKIIPNRLTFTLFETGIIFTFLYGLNNLFIARDSLLGALAGFVIFGVIALLGRLIAGKEAMGIGDVKLLAVLGLYFRTPLTISIAILSFIIAGIISVIIMKSKKKNKSEYISFGPCICFASMLCIIFPEEAIISVLLTVFTLGRYRG